MSQERETTRETETTTEHETTKPSDTEVGKTEVNVDTGGSSDARDQLPA